MANFNDIKHEIDQNVNTNGVQAITGAILNETLKDMIDEVDEKKQDTLVAGQNITIQGNVISASGGGAEEEYYAGTGINIDSNNYISVNPSEIIGYGLEVGEEGYIRPDWNVVASQNDIAGKQDKLQAGQNITISGNVISATDTNTTYSAGSGLNLNGTTFSADTSVLATKSDLQGKQDALQAGDGLEIDGNNEISVKAGSGLGFDSNGYLINTGGGGQGQTLYAGDGIEIDSNDAINAKLGNGLQLDQNNNIEIDPSVVASQSDLSGKEDALTEGQGINIDSNNVISVDASELAGNGMIANSSGYLEPDFSVVASQSDLQGKQDVLQAGANITINGNTISATDTNTTYSAGSGLNLNGTTFSVNTNSIQEKLTAGQNITIQNNVISATGGSSVQYSAGNGISIDQNNEISVDASDLAGSGLMVDQNGALAVIGGGGSGLWVNGTGTNSLMAPESVSSGATASGTGALNAGYYDSNHPGSLSAASGDYSAAFGTGTWAQGDNSFVSGTANTAQGQRAFIGGGINNVASGRNSAVLGGDGGHAVGENTVAISGGYAGPGNGAIAIHGTASALGSVSINGTSEANTSTAIQGGHTYSTASGSVAIIGETDGQYSVALGKGTHAWNENEVATGSYNKTYQSQTASIATSFTVGNGASGAPSNALEIKKNSDVYLVGVGGYDGTNAGASGVITLQDAINNGGGGQSYSAGNGIDIDQNNEISVDTTYLDGKYLPLQGGALQEDAAGVDRTQLIILSPGDSDVSIAAEVSQDEANTQISLENNAVYETEPGQGESITDITINNNSETGFALGIASHFVDDNGDWVRDDFESGEFFYSPAGQAVPAEIHLDTSSSNLSDPGNETSEAKITIQDDRGYVEFNPTGFYNGSYTLYYPSLSQDETIATLSDIQSGSYTAGSGIDITNDVISVDTTTIQSKLTAGANITINGNTISATDTNTTYSAGQGLNLNGTTFSADTTVLQEKLVSGTNIKTVNGNSLLGSGNIVISGGGSYTAGQGINIDQNNEISVDTSYLDGIYLPLQGGTLQEDPNDSASTELLIQSPETYSTADLTTVDLDPGNTAESLAKLTLSDYDSSSNPHTAIYGTTGISNGTYKISFPTLSGDDTFALLSDVQGSGSSYSAGNGISISAQNVITNTAPDPGFWVAGSGLGSMRHSQASNANGSYSVAIGYQSQVNPSSGSFYNTAIAGGQIGNISMSDISHATAIGNAAYCTKSDTIALGTGTRAMNVGEASIGYYANSITNGTTAENTRFTVGNGAASYARSNLIEAKQNNDLYIYGVGSFDGTNASSASTLQAVLSGKQDLLTAGSGITIQNNVISATGGGGGGSCLWSSSTGTNSLISPGAAAGVSSDAAGTGAITVGYDATADGDYAFACGAASVASGDYSFAANNGTAEGDYSAAFSGSGAYGDNSFAAGGGSTAGPDNSVALGGGIVVFDDETDPQNPINAQYGVAIGDGSIVNGEYGTAIGAGVVEAGGNGSVAIGSGSTAAGLYDVAVSGGNSRGNYSFAASSGQTDSQGHYASALSGGYATGESSLASGQDTNAWSYSSIALGLGVNTYDQVDGSDRLDTNAGEVALGRYNYSESGIIFSIGCGYYDTEGDQEVRENSVAIDTDGKIYLKGLGGYTGQGVSGCTDLVSFLNNL